jgi:hypothetical protein
MSSIWGRAHGGNLEERSRSKSRPTRNAPKSPRSARAAPKSPRSVPKSPPRKSPSRATAPKSPSRATAPKSPSRAKRTTNEATKAPPSSQFRGETKRVVSSPVEQVLKDVRIVKSMDDALDQAKWRTVVSSANAEAEHYGCRYC